jgi:transcriptional regulator of acetoin/glycerol metabolism
VLIDHPWPGNLRELWSIVERAARLATGERVRLADLEAAGFVPAEEPPWGPAAGSMTSPLPRSRRASASLAMAQPSRAEGAGERDEDVERGAAEPATTGSSAAARGVRRRRRR